MRQPRTRLSATVLGSPDPRALASFYERLLGWTSVADEPPAPGASPADVWVTLGPHSGGTGLSFQYEPEYTRPVWPNTPGAQQMTMHLDIAVENLAAGVAWACEAGATLADHQPQAEVRVMLDPDGNPFCLFSGDV